MPGYAQAMIKHCSHKPSIYAGVTDQASRCWRCCARSLAIYAHLLPGGGLQAWCLYLQKPVHLFPFSMKIYACWQFYWPFAQLASADNPPMLQLMGLNLPTPLHVYKPYPHTSGSMQRPSKNPSGTQGSTPESDRRWGAAIFCHPSQGRQAQQLSCSSNTLYRSLCVIPFWDCLQWSPSRAKYAASYLVHHYLQKNTLWLRSSLYRPNGTETTVENNVL